MTLRQARTIRGFLQLGYLPKYQHIGGGEVRAWMNGNAVWPNGHPRVDTIVVTIQPDGSYRQFEGYEDKAAA